MEKNRCQIHCLPTMSQNLWSGGVVWQRRNRIKRVLKRRWNYLMNSLSRIKEKSAMESTIVREIFEKNPLEKGDLVKVRSMEEIKSTLDRWNTLKGCGFMFEMRKYCGTTQRVFKRVNKFLDERDYLMKKCRGIIILEGVYCEGTEDFGFCDRTCFFFWREEWLSKIEERER